MAELNKILAELETVKKRYENLYAMYRDEKPDSFYHEQKFLIDKKISILKNSLERVGKNSLQIASIRVKIENTFVPINNKKIIMIVGLTEPETRLLLQAKGYEVISITTIETMKPLKPENLHEIIYK